jgi:hypothetical protein
MSTGEAAPVTLIRPGELVSDAFMEQVAVSLR